jgi:adenylate cyclase
MKSQILRALAVGAVVLAVFLALHALGLFRTLEWKTWDWRLQLLSDSSRADSDIVLILVDQPSLDLYEKEMALPWPWPREMYAALVNHCRQGGARVVAFDLIFSERSAWEGDDERFAEAIKEAGNVFLSLFISSSEEGDSSIRKLERFAWAAEDIPEEKVQTAGSVTLPVSNLLESAAGVGNVRFTADRDGIYRRLPMFFRLGEQVLPGLSGVVAGFLNGRPNTADFPVDASGRMIIRYHGPVGTYAAYSAAAVINSYAQMSEGGTPQIPPETFKDKIVLVGASAPGLMDLRPTPLSPVYPGAELHATVIDNLLNRDFIRVTPFPAFVLILAFFIFLTSFSASLLPKTWMLSGVISGCLILPAAAAAGAYYAGWWLEMAAPLAGVLTAFIAVALIKYTVEGRQRRFIKNSFQYYLSPHVIEGLIKDPDKLRLGGERRQVTSFFSDVAGFTSISESLSPEELVSLLNDYLSEMTDIILNEGGTLDKYEGDAIIAFWNAPLDQPDHALRGSRAALRCLRRQAELEETFQRKYGKVLSMRIGLNSGPAVVGNMGSRERFDYTAMGDTINLAARLEGACKQYKIHNLAGENTFLQVQDFLELREVDRIRVVGRKDPVTVYELLGEKDSLDPDAMEHFRLYKKALLIYKDRKWEEAASLFRSLDEDPVVSVYLERITVLKNDSPEKDWDGVFDLKEK